ncbi:acetyl-CoA synthetase [Artemisia annua]|uniref:Acetyl-CoA synthetase n=1 Tax=Artemisia annua TaxID=35608 RepID=A0A2U1MRK7_ARTAN|nr:acetyl-CoA synthetase [Artemisia annua]
MLNRLLNCNRGWGLAPIPQGVLHTTCGYMIYTATTFKYAFDYKDSDIYWWRSMKHGRLRRNDILLYFLRARLKRTEKIFRFFKHTLMSVLFLSADIDNITMCDEFDTYHADPSLFNQLRATTTSGTESAGTHTTTGIGGECSLRGLEVATKDINSMLRKFNDPHPPQ